MAEGQCVLAIDQGTSSSRAIVFDATGDKVASAQYEFPQLYPHDGWVEHDPEAIWQTTLTAAQEAFATAEKQGRRVAAVGITNQRETTLVWERATGEPVHNAIVWQDRRTADICDSLRNKVSETEISARTGLLLDPYFSATKLAWILDHEPSARMRAAAGELAFGTVDSFLVWRLTGGQVHATDATNASRTNLFNILTQEWDDWLLDLFDVPAEVLPEVRDCNAHFGDTDPRWFGRALPILGIAGDQQAAALGQCCITPGSIKSTYGTGCFVILNTGAELLESRHRLLATVAARVDGTVQYGLEGSIFIAGAAVQWLRDGIGIIESSAASEMLAESADPGSGVYVVPAFTGLAAPHWQPHARGAIFGLTRSSGRAELVKATLQSVAYQTSDLMAAMQADGARPERLRVDGAMAANNWFLQFVADMLQVPVDRPRILETTAYGAALLAGQGAGIYGDWESISSEWRADRQFEPAMASRDRDRLLTGWQKSLAAVLKFSER